jgi:sugar phosphate isomerase/epimerase
MKLGIDSYCYHRFFGDWYPDLQTDPGSRMTVWDFLDRARAYGAQGVSLESCYMPEMTEEFITRLRAKLSEFGLEPVWAWGHPDGLASGTRPEAVEDVVRHLEFTRRIGGRVMRICGGSRRTRPGSWTEHKAGLVPVLKALLAPAEQSGVVLAIENHIDLLADEMVEVIEAVNSPWLRVCLDTGNNLRLFEDPIVVAAKLAQYTAATHIKSLTTQRGDPKAFQFWPSVPLGEGLVDIAEVVRLLREARYTGLLAVEVDYLHPDYGDEDAAVSRSLRYLRALLSSAS